MKTPEMINALSLFSTGVGPSSSHTVGPMKAGLAFIRYINTCGYLSRLTRIRIDVFGSLSLTGRGHKTDSAILLGLGGHAPETVDITTVNTFMDRALNKGLLELSCGERLLPFDPHQDLIFHDENLPLHENALTISGFQEGELLYKNTWYSTGGGNIVDEEHFSTPEPRDTHFPFSWRSAEELLALCSKHQCTIDWIARQNERVLMSDRDLASECQRIKQTMFDCRDRGFMASGVLPGPLQIKRRAPQLYSQLTAATSVSGKTNILEVLDWINLFAMAVSEENAAGGRVVTAPTNGACGIIPAVMSYYDRFVASLNAHKTQVFLLTAGAIGALYKMNASISGAEVGCQGEVGVACSMASAGLAALTGCSPEQVCIAAEIGMEHNLGLTCDPVGGQVQIPCIERNAIGAVKAINAARMALNRKDRAWVSLDKVIETMYETGKDMNVKYRETSQGGLAIKVRC
ncbi:L-serine dehydratase [Klebsiella variicola]|nr:L-serine dehydratase [Klebsiella variicola]VAR92449.1 L-serine dehydratase [Klebsiella variicola]